MGKWSAHRQSSVRLHQFLLRYTNNIKFGTDNIIAVEVKNEGQNSRWYSGSGIYRHVWLKIEDPVHVVQWGPYITTPLVSATAAQINIQTKMLNESAQTANVSLITRIVNAAGTDVAKAESKQAMSAKDTVEFK